MKRRNRDLKRTKIEIIPMIDTMFFLLVFFLLSALSIINLESLGLNLPKEDSASKPKIEKVDSQLTVAIKKDGNVFVNSKFVLPDAIGQALLDSATAQERAKRKQPNAVLTEEAIRKMSVVISAETGVTHGLVVTCIDSARQKGMERFAISVDKSIIPKANP
ncbi:MAG: biopolymer transporter ExbD [Akkermansiaceae bacterium]|nr:biopolymer transporter ExbD [Armatimonadota bacterium]